MEALSILVLVCLACGGAARAQAFAQATWNASCVTRCSAPAAPERPRLPRSLSAQTPEDRCWRVAPFLPATSAPQTAAAAPTRLHTASGPTLPRWLSEGRIAELLVWLRDSGWPAELCKALKAAHDGTRWCVKAVLPEPTYIRHIEEWMRSSLVPQMRSGVRYVRGLIKSYDREKAALYIRTTIEDTIKRYKEAREETIKWIEDSKIIEYSVILLLTVITHVTLVWISIQTI